MASLLTRLTAPHAAAGAPLTAERDAELDGAAAAMVTNPLRRTLRQPQAAAVAAVSVPTEPQQPPSQSDPTTPRCG